MKKIFLFLAILLTLHSLPVFAEEDRLTEEEKIYGLSLAWSEAKYSFADFHLVPELDWEQAYREYIPKVLAAKTRIEYYRVLQEFYALLKEGHSYIRLPKDILEGSVKKAPLMLREFEGKAVVTHTAQSLSDVIPVGSVILSVNGVPTNDYLKKNVIPLINMGADHTRLEFAISGAGALGIGLTMDTGPDVIVLSLEMPDEAEKTLEVARVPFSADVDWVPELEDTLLDFKWLENDIAYVSLNSFGDSAIVDQFKAIAPELKNAKGLILDVRKNGGGSSDYGYAIMQYIIEEPVETSKWETREHIGAFTAWGQFVEEYAAYADRKAMHLGEEYFIEPIEEEKRIIIPTAVLSSHRTFSAAEDFLVSIDLIPHITIVGEPSGGSTGQPLYFELPGGGSGQVTSKHDYFPDGREFVGVGVQPDIFVSPTVEDFRAGRDPILEKAIEVVKTQLAK